MPAEATRRERKNQLRRAAYDARNAEPAKDDASRRAVGRLLERPEYLAARTVMWYVDCRSELRTRFVLADVLSGGQRIVVPYCTEDEQGQNKLGLWILESVDELVVGKWKIMEPPRERWGEAGKELAPADLDLIVVPGVGFTRDGARMGNGQGYYDRLLEQARPDCVLAALCYESQLFDELVVDEHDVFMDLVITESAVYTNPDSKRIAR